MQRFSYNSAHRQHGFTMLELVLTLVILAILAAEAWPRFANRQSFERRGFSDQTRAAIQYGRKVAVATGRNVCVNASASTLVLTMANGRGSAAACSADVTNPATGDAYSITSPASDVYYGSSLSLTFHASGVPSAAGSLIVHGDTEVTILIDGATGYVR